MKSTKPVLERNFVNIEQNEQAGSPNASLAYRKPRLLLHACCGPCSTSCVERVADEYEVTLYYYNPNIMDREEYLRRREALLKFIDAFNADNEGRTRVEYLEGEYDPERFIRLAEPMKDEPEGGKRCDMCFAMRLSDTAKMAKELGYDYFTTTMSVSPHKDYKTIAELGFSLEENTGVKYLDIDFKKRNGFGRSVEMSKMYGLYRQNFCGCEYARAQMKKN